MEDIATLGLAVQSDQVATATDRNRKFAASAEGAEKSAKGLEHTTKLLSAAMGILGAALSVNQLIRMTSVWTDMTSRVRNAIAPHESVADVMGRLDDMARRTYSSLEQTAESYLRNATALEQLGYSTSQQLDLTESLNNALVVSAVKGERAESVMNAWAKAMALGKLSGDNLNTIMESGDRLAEALADSMGVTVLQLRALGAAGKITSKDMFGITSELEKLREEADAMPATIHDAFTLLGNALLSTVGRLDEALGASTALAGGIIALGDNADALVPIIGALAAVVSAALVPAFVSATVAIVAFLASPIGIAAMVIGGVVFAITALWNEQRLAEQTSRELAAALVTNANGLETAKTASQSFRDELRSQILTQMEAAKAALATAQALVIQRAVMANQLSSLPLIGPMLSGGLNAMNQFGGMDTINAAMENVETLKKQLAEIDEIMKTTPGADTPVVHTITEGQAKAQEKAAKAYADMIRGSREFVAAQQIEAQALGMTEEAASRLRHEQDLLNQAANDNIKLTPAQTTELMGLAAAMAQAEEQTRQLTEAYDFGKSTFNSFFSDIKSGLQDGMSAWDAFANAGASALDRIADRALSMAADGIFDMIFGALMGGISGGVTGGAWGNGLWGSAIFNARGNVFQSHGLSAYSNSIVTQPTVFPFARGVGLMGEAGPEAIMPLKRGPDGRLGVSAANTNNDSNAGPPVQIVFNIQTPDVAGFKRSEAQIAAQMARLAARGQRVM